MDAFYASVEQRDNPELRGKPVAVGGTSNRGVVAAASYEAREFGVRSAMPIREALRRCPQLERVKPRMNVYREVSKQVFDVFRSYSPLVEGLSLDEAFIDVTDSLRLFGSGESIAAAIKEQVFETTGLRASVGVAGNKLVAKIASDLDKPDGLVVIPTDRVNAMLDPLPVSVIPGIGRETLSRLDTAGIATVGDLRTCPENRLQPIFGRYTAKTIARASGVDDRPVQPDREEKSISAEETFDRDLEESADMERALLALTERCSSRMRKAGLGAGTVQIKIRESDFTTCTRQRAMRPPTNSTDVIYAAGRALLAEWRASNPAARIRLLGIGGAKLVEAAQQDLFSADSQPSSTRVDSTVDEIRQRFGDKALGRARTIDPS